MPCTCACALKTLRRLSTLEQLVGAAGVITHFDAMASILAGARARCPLLCSPLLRGGRPDDKIAGVETVFCNKSFHDIVSRLQVRAAHGVFVCACIARSNNEVGALCSRSARFAC